MHDSYFITCTFSPSLVDFSMPKFRLEKPHFKSFLNITNDNPNLTFDKRIVRQVSQALSAGKYSKTLNNAAYQWSNALNIWKFSVKMIHLIFTPYLCYTWFIWYVHKINCRWETLNSYCQSFHWTHYCNSILSTCNQKQFMGK